MTKAATVLIVRDATARMPRSCWGRYRRVAVLEVDPTTCPRDSSGRLAPRMISSRARGVVRVVKTWERLRTGSTPRCAHERALFEARELVGQTVIAKLATSGRASLEGVA